MQSAHQMEILILSLSMVKDTTITKSVIGPWLRAIAETSMYDVVHIFMLFLHLLLLCFLIKMNDFYFLKGKLCFNLFSENVCVQ